MKSKVNCSLFDLSVVSSTMTAMKGELWIFSKIFLRAWWAISYNISFQFFGEVCLCADFSIHCKISGLSSAFNRSSCIKFDDSSRSPRSASPCHARKQILAISNAAYFLYALYQLYELCQAALLRLLSTLGVLQRLQQLHGGLEIVDAS